jgi:single-strand DNA-binding protein
MYNKTIIVGRITKKPELKYTTNNVPYIKFDVAVGRSYKSASGEYETDFFNCMAWNATAERIASRLDKGLLVLVEGNIEFGSYNNRDGKTIYTTTLQAMTVKYLEPKTDTQSSNYKAPVEDYSQAGQQHQQAKDDVTDDSLPF